MSKIVPKFLVTSIAALAAVVGTSASAQDAAAPTRPDRGGDMTRAQTQEHAARIFERMDANDDGKIDAADRTERQRTRFERMDANDDGALSYDEFAAGRAAKPGQPAEQPGAGRGGRGQTGGGMMAMAAHADSDGDGAISQAEFAAASMAMFDRADADRNGTVTAAERRAAHQAMGAMQHGPASE